MPYKVKNKTKDNRKFREHKTAKAHFLRPGEEIIISNKPFTQREDVFKITDLNKTEESEKEEKPNKKKREKSERRKK